ncbi:MAG TPA: carboxypeptidase-like regulatory domain-containing protein [Prolixibacteraceae bacterium]|nr:carboxypeptidase-like regulatory domain-containing protein [Prolixibacteraceae bacterium]HPR59866.1 carboxypeptidase-like regulatory domain-containing protein [Prolixibacteraceae bacterium]
MKHILFITLFVLPLLGFTQNLFTLNGHITDNDTGKAINDASIWIAEEKIGTISDDNGEFLLHLPAGKYQITIAANNYEEKTIQFILVENIEQEIKLNAESSKRRKNHFAKTQKQQKQISNSFDVSSEIADLHYNIKNYKQF